MSANSLYCRSIIMHKWVSNLTTCVRGYKTPMFLHKIKRRARLHAKLSLLAINRCAKVGVTQFSTYLFKKKNPPMDHLVGRARFCTTEGGKPMQRTKSGSPSCPAPRCDAVCFKRDCGDTHACCQAQCMASDISTDYSVRFVYVQT
jgi:hypothetical protein